VTTDPCVTPESFIERWWRITQPAGLDENCYLFSEDGFLVQRDSEGNNTPMSAWSAVNEECLREIYSDLGDLEVYGWDADECISAEYGSTDVTLCECLP